MALELSELRSFLVLAQHLHFGEAAEALHVSQPALTKQIQKLEAKVEGPLLVRGYRRVSLTPAGEILRDRAQSLLREAEMAEEIARLAVQGKAGLLRIGFGIASLAAGLAGYTDAIPPALSCGASVDARYAYARSDQGTGAR